MFLLFTKTVSRPNAEGVEDCSVVSVEPGGGELCRTVEVGGRAVGGPEVYGEARVGWDRSAGDCGGLGCCCAEEHVGGWGVEA
jgi:hypothetical protein